MKPAPFAYAKARSVEDAVKLLGKQNWRKAMRKAGDDPFGDTPSEDLSKKQLDETLTKGDPEAAGLLHGAIEEFSQELALVIRRFLKVKAWAGTERIVMGGGFRASRIGELAIGRAAVILKTEKIKIDLVPIRNDPDEAGLLGAAHLAPAWMFKAHDAILAVDIGGSNIRAGIVDLNLKKRPTCPRRRFGNTSFGSTRRRMT